MSTWCRSAVNRTSLSRLATWRTRSSARGARVPALGPERAALAVFPLASRATGVIEGACRHLVKDRMDITGARWSLEGAEAVLKMRAVVSNRDFEEYWRYHLAREQERVRSRYAAEQSLHNAIAA